MPALILNQLRWLDHIVNGKVYTSSCSWFESILCVQDLCRELLEVVGVAPVEIQREIVTAIPEILDDAQHNNAALELKLVGKSAEKNRSVENVTSKKAVLWKMS